MMDGIKSWLIALMAAALVGEILLLLAPKGNTAKILKIAVSVFFLGCFLSPFATLGSGGLDDITFDYHTSVSSGAENLDNTMQKQTLEEFERNIKQIVTVNLRDLDVTVQKVEVQVNMGEDNSIQINCIGVWLDQSAAPREKELSDALKSVFGYKTQFVFTYTES